MEKGYTNVPQYTGKGQGRLHVQDMFDMLSGTSTGSIMASALSLATPPDANGVILPKFWAEDMKNIYIDNAAEIFQSNTFGAFVAFLIYFFCIIILGGMFLRIGIFRYDNPKIHLAHKELEKEILQKKEELE